MFERLEELIAERKFTEVRQILIEAQPADLAEYLDSVPVNEALRLFRLLPKSEAADTFSYMPKDLQQNIVEEITDREVSGIMKELFLDDAVDFIEEMPANVVKKVLANAGESKRKLINQFLQYEDDSAGSRMTIEFVDLRSSMTVAEAFDHIRKTGINKETVYTCYVIDKNRVLEGIITVRDMLFADKESTVGEIMDTNVLYVSTDADQEVVGLMFSKYDLLSIPVVDKERRLVGIITVDDAVEVIQEENTEDIEKMAALTPSNDTYLRTSVFTHSKNRIIWLLILMLSATFTAAIIENFRTLFVSVPLLVSFIPMLMGAGGNSGTQASTIVIRGIALDEIRGSDFLKVWWKELRVAALVGFVLAGVNVLNMCLIQGKDLNLALTVSLSLYATVIIAKSVGSLLPIFAKQIRLDPAIMATPILTTIVDAVALLVYFSIAQIFFNF